MRQPASETVVKERIRVLNGAPVRPDGACVMHWAGADRRVKWRAPSRSPASSGCHYEGVTCACPHANGRLHTFLLEGVPETERRLKRLRIGYCFSLRRRFSDPEDTSPRVAERAACVVADDYPACFPALLIATVPELLQVRYKVVDASYIVTMNLLAKREYAACTACQDALETMIRIHAAGRWTGAARTHTRTSCGASGCTTGSGRSVRCSAWSATCRWAA